MGSARLVFGSRGHKMAAVALNSPSTRAQKNFRPRSSANACCCGRPIGQLAEKLTILPRRKTRPPPLWLYHTQSTTTYTHTETSFLVLCNYLLHIPSTYLLDKACTRLEPYIEYARTIGSTAYYLWEHFFAPNMLNKVPICIIGKKIHSKRKRM